MGKGGSTREEYLPSPASSSSDTSRRGRSDMSRRTRPESSTDQLIESLRNRRYNRLTELRRIEVVAANSSEEDQEKFQAPMTAAWANYVNSNNLLNELRGLTRNYPFSSECLDEAKWLVLNDPESNRSWNLAWLILVKIQEEELIQKHADASAALPHNWGGRLPDEEEAAQLSACFAWEWERAVEQMLDHWDTPPTTTGY